MFTRVHLRVPDQHPRVYPYPYIAHPGGYGYQLESARTCGYDPGSDPGHPCQALIPIAAPSPAGCKRRWEWESSHVGVGSGLELCNGYRGYFWERHAGGLLIPLCATCLRVGVHHVFRNFVFYSLFVLRTSTPMPSIASSFDLPHQR
jgi:hypothetical protein